MLASWVTRPAAALNRLDQMHERLRKRLGRAGAASNALIVAILVIAAVAVLSILRVPWRGDAVFSSASEAPAWLLAHYPLAILLAAVECILIKWRTATLRRIRDYENQLAFFSEMDVVVSAAITLKRPETLDRSMEALTAAQKSGVLSAPHSERAGARRRAGILASVLRPLIK